MGKGCVPTFTKKAVGLFPLLGTLPWPYQAGLGVEAGDGWVGRKRLEVLCLGSVGGSSKAQGIAVPPGVEGRGGL